MADEFREHMRRMLEADEQLLLGRLVWYSVSDVHVPHENVVRALVQAGIDRNLPLPPKDADVFRRVCSKSERKKLATDDPNIFENFMVRDVGVDTDKVFRRIVGEKLDAKGRRLNYEQLIDVTFDKGTSNITLRGLGPKSDTADTVAASILSGFKEEQGTLNSYAVREWIRHFILDLSATQVRPGGGVYFVSEDHTADLEAMESFTQQLPGSVVFHTLPLIDDRKQREMLKQAYEQETAGEVDKMIEEITTIKQMGRKISNSRYEEMLGKYHHLLGKTKEYSTLLDEQLGMSTSRLDLLMRQMLELTQHNVRI